MTETAPARANRDGSPCPDWCVTDHAEFSFHGSERITIHAADYSRYYVRAIRHSVSRSGCPSWIQLAGAGIASVRPDDAEGLADLIGQLAGATPDEHRELAAAIRQAAAQAGDG